MITVIGCGISKTDIPQKYIEVINKADILVGGKRLLDFFKDNNSEKIIINKFFMNSISNFIEKHTNDNVVFLASGDSLFHGIGKQLSELISPDKLTILPNITAAQSLFAKLKIPWNNANFYSVHGKEKLLPFHKILMNKLSLIYCDNRMTASQAAAMLIEHSPSSKFRKGAIGENLGKADEKITVNTLLSLSDQNTSSLSILVILPDNSNAVNYPGLPLGMPDEYYGKTNNCITHSEVRAVVLSKLKLGYGTVWDLGAGSGSVGIEAALLSTDSTVYAVEKESSRTGIINENRTKFGCSNLEIINKTILNAIPELPVPTSVFIGGGGNDLKEILTQTYEKLMPGGRIVATSVLLESTTTLLTTLKQSCIEVITMSINRSVPLKNKNLMKSDNTITIFIYGKPYEE